MSSQIYPTVHCRNLEFSIFLHGEYGYGTILDKFRTRSGDLQEVVVWYFIKYFIVLILIQEAGTSLQAITRLLPAFCDVYIVHLLGIMKPGSKAFLFQVTNSLGSITLYVFRTG